MALFCTKLTFLDLLIDYSLSLSLSLGRSKATRHFTSSLYQCRASFHLDGVRDLSLFPRLYFIQEARSTFNDLCIATRKDRL